MVGHPLLQEGQVTQISETYVPHEFRQRNSSVPQSQIDEFRVGTGETVPQTTDNDWHNPPRSQLEVAGENVQNVDRYADT